MATPALYRRYRPRKFSEIKGQEHVVRALRDAVANGREGQAYLFSGPRGTGKTTSARVLAKVLNCERPDGGEPCCECPSCIDVERGVSYDVHELDAASNNGVDAMRDLIEKAQLGTPGRHKVYILDEVHMLSKAAEAALLKTLEEPPDHVVFVLATTDPQKVSETIRSRTQHLRFHLLAPDLLIEHLQWVAADAGLELDQAAIGAAVAEGGGSARDSLSALELIASAGGVAEERLDLDDYLDALADHDAGRILTLLASDVNAGNDARTIAEALVGRLRNAFLALMAPELVQLPGAALERLADVARHLGPASITTAIERIGGMLVELRHAPDPRVLVEVTLVQLALRSAGAHGGAGGGVAEAGGDAAQLGPAGSVPANLAADFDALVDRINKLEAAVQALQSSPRTASPVDPATGRAKLGGRARRADDQTAVGDAAASVPGAAGVPATAGASTGPVSPAAPGAGPPAGRSSGAPTGDPRGEWEHTIRPGLRGLARALFAPVEFAGFGEGVVTLTAPSPVHQTKCAEHLPAVAKAWRDQCGRTVELRWASGNAPVSPPPAAPVAPSPAGTEAPASATPRTSPPAPTPAAPATGSGVTPAPAEQPAPGTPTGGPAGARQPTDGATAGRQHRAPAPADAPAAGNGPASGRGTAPVPAYDDAPHPAEAGIPPGDPDDYEAFEIDESRPAIAGAESLLERVKEAFPGARRIDDD